MESEAHAGGAEAHAGGAEAHEAHVRYGEQGHAALDAFFRDNPYFLTAHHLASFDAFLDRRLAESVRSMNPLVMIKEDGGKRYRVELFVGGKSVYLDRPTIVDPDGAVRPLFPNEARLKDLTYGCNLYADVEVRAWVDDAPQDPVAFDRVHIGAVPLMLHSRMCLLHGMPDQVLREMGECPNDRGGYFVVDGREKVIITQEARVVNRLYVRRGELHDEDIAFRAWIECMPRDATDVFPRTFVAYVRSSKATTRPNALSVTVTHIDKSFRIPVFVLFRALGVESDRAIMEHVVYDPDAPGEADVVDFLRASAVDAADRNVWDQRSAIEYLVPHTRFKTEMDLKSIFVLDLFPNVGPEFAAKALMLGDIVRRVVRSALGKAPLSKLDDYTNKRLLPAGAMMAALFRDVYNRLHDACLRGMNAEFGSGVWRTTGDVRNLVNASNLRTMLPPNMVRDMLLRSMKGAWGADPDAAAEDEQAEGKVQDMNRVSFFTYASHVRRVNNGVSREVKMAEPHKMLASHWGALCPIESPDGPNVGLLNHLALLCHVSPASDPAPVMKELEDAGLVRPTSSFSRLKDLRGACRVLVNDTWEAVTYDPDGVTEHVRAMRRAGRADRHVSVAWNIVEQEVHVHTDAGRCCRPLAIVDAATRLTRLPPPPSALSSTGKARESWASLFVGGGEKQQQQQPPVLEMVDVEELSTRLVAMRPSDIERNKTHRYTHCELHPASILSAVTNTYPLLDHNYSPYNVFCLAQFKQAVGTYVTNFASRMDTMGCVLHYPQRPMVSTDFADQLCRGQLAHGENLVVAIATYTGYNQEDSILLNHDSVERGRFHLTYYATERFRETPPDAANGGEAVVFRNPVAMEAAGTTVRGIKKARYDKLAPDGTPLRDSVLDEDDVLMGSVHMAPQQQEQQGANAKAPPTMTYTDRSKVAGRHAGGCVVDRVFVYPYASGFGGGGGRRCKVLLRQTRQPELGDKLGSRYGQKGVVGMLLRSRDMPFGHESGIVPDIVLNPNAFPKRMTVAHMLECLLGKAGTARGSRFNANNFEAGDVVGGASDVLHSLGFQRHGDEVMYNGRSGEQMGCDVFVGVNYYGRFKHMVADKYQSRMRGPSNAITRQPAKTPDGNKNGGLRLGEMEQNALMAHGITSFVKEAFMDRSDRHRMTLDASQGVPVRRDAVPHPFDDARDAAPVPTASVEVPYAFKLLQQELSAMSLDMRLDAEAGWSKDASGLEDHNSPVDDSDEEEADGRDVLDGEDEGDDDGGDDDGGGDDDDGGDDDGGDDDGGRGGDGYESP